MLVIDGELLASQAAILRFQSTSFKGFCSITHWATKSAAEVFIVAISRLFLIKSFGKAVVMSQGITGVTAKMREGKRLGKCYVGPACFSCLQAIYVDGKCAVNRHLPAPRLPLWL